VAVTIVWPYRYSGLLNIERDGSTKVCGILNLKSAPELHFPVRSSANLHLNCRINGCIGFSGKGSKLKENAKIRFSEENSEIGIKTVFFIFTPNIFIKKITLSILREENFNDKTVMLHLVPKV
jgi:hypothetical protein